MCTYIDGHITYREHCSSHIEFIWVVTVTVTGGAWDEMKVSERSSSPSFSSPSLLMVSPSASPARTRRTHYLSHTPACSSNPLFIDLAFHRPS